jgi:hypothetical protein
MSDGTDDVGHDAVLDPELREWPRAGQRLIASKLDGDHRRLNACFFMDGDFNIYAYGYREAAQRLFEHVREHQRNIDTLIYPFVFSWRQYLELRLKKMIFDGRYLGDEDAGFPAHHRIGDLWREARRHLQEIAEDMPEYSALDSIIGEFANADPDSFHYRYPTRKDGVTPTVPPGAPNLNWTNFHDVMLGVANFLDAAQCELDRRVDYKLDYEALATNNC